MRNLIQYITASRNRLSWHILFWSVYVLFFGLFFGSTDGDYGYAFAEILLSLPVKMLFTYSILYYFIPQFLLKRRYFPFIGFLIIACIAFGLLQRAIFYYGIQLVYDFCFEIESPLMTPLTPTKIVTSLISMYIVAALAVVIKLIKYIYKKEKEQQELAQKKLEAELNFLKSQIHPHFLFNTLNNLYALTLKNSSKAPEVVLKLSELLDYMLYECNVDKIPASKEVNLINNYLSLEKLRYGDRLDVSFNYSVESMDTKIAPMLILPFVENAFKHGVSNKTDTNWLLIDLKIKGRMMTLKVENSKSDERKVRIVEKEHNKGIGLTNVRRRLNLLYEKSYDLQIFNEEDTFLVVLKLELDEISVAPQLEFAS
ncbi:MAG: sensor histidine kinase [Saprospiraceae bacterium]